MSFRGPDLSWHRPWRLCDRWHLPVCMKTFCLQCGSNSRSLSYLQLQVPTLSQLHYFLKFYTDRNIVIVGGNEDCLSCSFQKLGERIPGLN